MPPYPCTKPPRERVLPQSPRGVAQDFRSFREPGCSGLSLTQGAAAFSKGAAVSCDPCAPEAAKQAAFVVWAQAAPGSGTKGGKKSANPLRTSRRAFPLWPICSWEPSGVASGPHGSSAAAESEQRCPGNERRPGQPRSARQTQAWPGAWEGAGLIQGRTRLKAPPGDGDQGLIPACAWQSLPTPLGPAGARGWGRGWDPSPLSSASVGLFIGLS